MWDKPKIFYLRKWIGCFYTIEKENNKFFIFYRKFVSFFFLVGVIPTYSKNNNREYINIPDNLVEKIEIKSANKNNLERAKIEMKKNLKPIYPQIGSEILITHNKNVNGRLTSVIKNIGIIIKSTKKPQYVNKSELMNLNIRRTLLQNIKVSILIKK